MELALKDSDPIEKEKFTKAFVGLSILFGDDKTESNIKGLPQAMIGTVEEKSVNKLLLGWILSTMKLKRKWLKK